MPPRNDDVLKGAYITWSTKEDDAIGKIKSSKLSDDGFTFVAELDSDSIITFPKEKMMNKIIIAPSILSADFAFLDSDDFWKDENVLDTINKELYNHELMLIGLECINDKGVFLTKLHEYNNYQDFFLSDNKVWCTAWARIIRKDKIVYLD